MIALLSPVLCNLSSDFPFLLQCNALVCLAYSRFVAICISNFPFLSQVLGNQVSILIFFYPLFSFDRLTMHSSKWFPFLVSSTWSCPPSKGLQNSTINKCVYRIDILILHHHYIFSTHNLKRIYGMKLKIRLSKTWKRLKRMMFCWLREIWWD